MCQLPGTLMVTSAKSFSFQLKSVLDFLGRVATKSVCDQNLLREVVYRTQFELSLSLLGVHAQRANGKEQQIEDPSQ